MIPGWASRALCVSTLSLLLGGATCAGGPSPEAQRRSQSEYMLAVGLMEEQNAPGAFDHAFRAIDLDPQNVDAHHLLALLFLGRGDLTKAEEHVRKALELTANPDLDFEPSLPSKIRNTLGVLLIERGRYDDAITELRTAIGDLSNTTPYLGWANLGLAYMRKREWAEAERSLQQAVRLRADLCVGYLRLGETYMATDRFADAETALTRLVEFQDPACHDNQDAWRMRGESRARLGHREDATRDLERCVELGQQSSVGQACQRLLESIH